MTVDKTRATLGAGNAEVALVRLLAALDSVQTAYDENVREARHQRVALPEALQAADRTARREAVDQFNPGDHGTELWKRLREAFPRIPLLWPQHTPAPENLADAAREFSELRRRTDEEVRELLRAQQGWEQRLFRRASSRPTVPQRLLHDLERMSRLHQCAGEMRDAHVVERMRVTRSRLEGEFDRRAAERSARLAELTAAADQLFRETGAAAGRVGLPWSDPVWADARTADRVASAIRIGELRPFIPSSDLAAPALLEFPFRSGLAIDGPVEYRERAISLVRALVVRLLAAVPAGNLRLIMMDPVSLGQSVAEFRHLSEFDPQLVDVKTWTSESQIARRLEELTDHLEVVISTYLRGQFRTIDDYNLEAGEVAEPYRLLVVLDYPEGFNDSAARHLLSLIENGPRCGVHTLLVHDPARESPRSVPVERLLHSMQRVTWHGGEAELQASAPVGDVRHTLVPDSAPPVFFDATGRATTPWAQLLLDVGHAARTSQSEPVTLARLLPVINRLAAAGRSASVPAASAEARPLDHNDETTWWSSETSQFAAAVLGRAGAQDVATLRFSSTEIAGGAIMIGVPRSGKSTALHAAIVTMALSYSPDELELYLIDSKHGVEFKAYDHLPHARMVAIRSEREFSVAVLQSLAAEIAARAALMKERGAGATNVTDYRTRTGDVLPRIVLVMDEFHEVFEEDDALGQRAFRAFSNIVRQGPFAGVHVVVASQTLTSTPALDKNVLQLLPMRVAFMCNESDADLVMGDENREVKALSRQGSGIVNPLRGAPEHNQLFQGLLIKPDERTCLLRKLSAKAARSGYDRQPRVFDGDAMVERIVPQPRSATPLRPLLPVGEPHDLHPLVGVPLRRARGANLLLLGAVEEEGQHIDRAAVGALHSCIGAAAEHGMAVQVVDFLGESELVTDELSVSELCRRAGAEWSRSRMLPRVLADLVELVRARQEGEDYRSTGRLLVLHGVHRALDLSPHSPYDYPDESNGPSAGSLLATLIREGPDVGVHTLASVDDLRQFDRRLGRDLLAEFEFRLVGSSASPGDISALTELHNESGVRHNQLMLVNVSEGTTRRMRAYPPFTASSLAHITTEN